MFWFMVWLVCAIVCTVVAGNKGRSTGWWFVLGVLLGPLALLAIAFMPSMEAVKQDRAAAGDTDTMYRKCPFCAEVVRREAIKCKHCQSDLSAIVVADAKNIQTIVAKESEASAEEGGAAFMWTASLVVGIALVVIWAFSGSSAGVSSQASSSYRIDAPDGVDQKTMDDATACTIRGIAYFKSIDSWPKLSDGRDAGEVAADRCARSPLAFGK